MNAINLVKKSLAIAGLGLGLAVMAACGGGGGGKELTLDEYFSAYSDLS